MPRVFRTMHRHMLPMLSACAAGLVVLAGPVPNAAAEGSTSPAWYLDGMQAERMWTVSRGEGITVAVIDTGVDATIPELQGRLVQGEDVSNRPLGPNTDEDGHGTNMAALIAGSGMGGGIQGLAPGAKIMPVRAIGSAAADATDPLMSRAIRYAVDHGARILNISMAGPGGVQQTPQSAAAVKYALGKGALVFAGSGNDGNEGNLPNYPAALPGVVSVGAIDSTSAVTKWSNSASNVALAAPGDRIPERCTKTTGSCMSGGTSQATALASASAALIWAKHPDWTNNQVLRVMLDTAGKPTTGKIPSPYIGYGIVRPRKVVLDGEGDPGPAGVNPLLANAAPTPSSEPKSSARGAQRPAAESSSDDSDVSTLWLSVGAGAAVVVVAAVVTGIVLVRRRNRTASHWSTGDRPVG